MGFAKRIADADRKKGYAHFDDRVTYRQVECLVENPEFVTKHAFYPLISTSIISTKYRKISDSSFEKHQAVKERSIAYASHIDHRIYQYYALLWSDRYELELEKAGAAESIIAYRRGKHLSNITGAAKAIGAIRSLDDALVLTGDFSNFFPSLDHRHLIASCRDLFDEGRLPEDHYRVLKSVTKHSCWPLEEILKIRGLDCSSKKQMQRSIRKLNRSNKHILSKSDFKANKERCLIKPWKESSKGIPQGLAVSGVLSNIYMLKTDSQIVDCLKGHRGVYSRYCDDFIVVLPWAERKLMTAILGLLQQVPGVDLHPDKTRYYRVRHNYICSVKDMASFELGKKTHLSYLGFDFDGQFVTLRAGTTGRFFNRYYRSIRSIQRRRRGATNKQRHSMYRRFSEKGNNPKASYRNQNFLSYAARAQKAFPNDPIYRPFEHMYKRLHRDCSQEV